MTGENCDELLDYCSIYNPCKNFPGSTCVLANNSYSCYCPEEGCRKVVAVVEETDFDENMVEPEIEEVDVVSEMGDDYGEVDEDDNDDEDDDTQYDESNYADSYQDVDTDDEDMVEPEVDYWGLAY